VRESEYDRLKKEAWGAFHSHDYRRALTLCEHLQRKHRDDPVILVLKADAHYELRELDSAISDYDDAIRICSEAPEFWSQILPACYGGRAAAFTLQGKETEAARDLAKERELLQGKSK
jgi:tetratricopeptide (TPR) repeat protein